MLKSSARLLLSVSMTLGFGAMASACSKSVAAVQAQEKDVTGWWVIDSEAMAKSASTKAAPGDISQIVLKKVSADFLLVIKPGGYEDPDNHREYSWSFVGAEGRTLKFADAGGKGGKGEIKIDLDESGDRMVFTNRKSWSLVRLTPQQVKEWEPKRQKMIDEAAARRKARTPPVPPVPNGPWEVSGSHAVTLKKGSVNADLVDLCKSNSSWIETLEFPYSRGIEIDSLEPLSSLSKLKKLQIRNISNFRETTIIPEPGVKRLDLSPLTKCLELEELTIDGVYVVGISQLNALPKLKILKLPNVTENLDLNPESVLEVLEAQGLRPADLAVIGKIKTMKSMRLSHPKVGNEDLKLLGGLINIESLDFFQTPGNLSSLDFLSNAEKLSRLEYSQGALAKDEKGLQDIGALASCENLTYVKIKAPITSISPLSGKSKLKSLSLWGTQVADISPLATCPSLEYLDLRNSKVSDIKAIMSLENLKDLSLPVAVPVTQIDEFKKSHPKCAVSIQ
ncbi:MAG: hypothetical protein RL095_2302 [Verrucomicrobiota bacterium]|jgi:internalin A